MKFGIRRSGAGIRKRFQVLAPGASLRKRVGYSLAIVRLILVPVIFLSIYYLLEIGWIVDRIVSFDAPAATLAQQASITMLEARHAERNYLLLYDPASLQSSRDSIQKIEQIMSAISDLQPSDEAMTQETLAALGRYNERFEAAVTVIGQPGQAPADRIDAVLMTYENDLDNLLKSDRYKTRAQLVDELRNRVGSFDAQITKTVQEGDPALRHITVDLQSTGQEVLALTGKLEAKSWDRVEHDHRKARRLISAAEWSLSVVSAITLLVSIWISFTLPKQVVKPLVSLKEAVDHAAAGNYEIEFDIQGEGEVVQLADSIRLLIAHLREATRYSES
ncbi:MAG: HAMP domain-containing protein [Candidatus Acidiferrum sp.]|jgi:nitrogen fixation/metabolism regulation signal transduction histidine kinase